MSTPPYGQPPYESWPQGNPASGVPYPQQYSGMPYPTSGYQPYPGPLPPGFSGGYHPSPYGVDPVSGVPFSDKSKIIAGLLQLLPGLFFGLGGIGRFYAGNTGLGIAQICVTLLGWGSFWLAICGSFLVVPILFIFVYGAAWLWFVIDGIVVLAGSPRDGMGRPLR